MEEEEDAALIGQFLEGNVRAGSQLVARHRDALFFRLLGKDMRREDAEDLLQVIWNNAIAKLPGLTHRPAFRSWLFTIAEREFAHWLRQSRQKGTCSLDLLLTRQDEGWQTALPACQNGTNADQMNAILDRLVLQEALSKLSEEHRETFVLRFVAQFTAVEVAQILNIPVGTVESRCHYAREQLKKSMQKEDCKQQTQTVSGEIKKKKIEWFRMGF